MPGAVDKPQTRHSVCPHDCPSQCPVEVERIDAHTTRCVYGTWRSIYTLKRFGVTVFFTNSVSGGTVTDFFIAIRKRPELSGRRWIPGTQLT